MKKRSFFIGASILAIGGFLAKILGAFYKIPLTHILGANGMGVYYLVFPFYSLALILASSGLSVAVTRLVSINRERFNRRTEQKILKIAILIAFCLSIMLVGLTILVAKPFSFLQGNGNSYLSYFAIAPAIVFASIVSVLKGYFQGVENMMPSSISLIIQQASRLIFGLLLAYELMHYGVQYSVLGAILGVTISEFVAMCYLIIRYVVYKKKQFYIFFEKRKDDKRNRIAKLKKECINKGKKICCIPKIVKQTSASIITKVYYAENKDCVGNKEIFVQLVKYTIPSTLASLITPLATFVDSFLVVNLLTSSGFTTTIATSLYGMSNGIVSSLISLPIVIISALSTSIVPNLSHSIEINSRETVIAKTNFFIKFSWIIALPMFLMFMLFAPEIVEILYSGGLSNKVIDEFAFSYRILAVSSISIIYHAFLYTFTAILNAFNKPEIPFYSQCIALVVRTILTFTLVKIPELNVFGLLIANIVFLMIACMGCVNRLKDIVPLRFGIKRFFGVPIISISVVGVLGYGVKKLCYGLLPAWLEIGIIGSIILLMYIVLLLSMRVFTVKEWSYLPIPKKLMKYLPKKVKSVLETEKVS